MTTTNQADRMKTKANEILAEAYASYVCEDGGMGIVEGLEIAAFPPFIRRTAPIDNATLFRAELEILRSKVGVITQTNPKATREAVTRYIRDLEVPSAKDGGLYYRNPGRVGNASFDEYLGVTALSVCIDEPAIARQICARGDKTGYLFNAEDPENPELKDWRQGIDVAAYKIAAGYAPTPYEFLWLTLGTFWAFFDPVGETSNALLNWVRLETIVMKLSRDDLNGVLKAYAVMSQILLAFWRLEAKLRRGGLVKIMQTYFGSTHPLPRLAEALEL
jgi:hypothetical protein